MNGASYARDACKTIKQNTNITSYGARFTKLGGNSDVRKRKCITKIVCANEFAVGGDV